MLLAERIRATELQVFDTDDSVLALQAVVGEENIVECYPWWCYNVSVQIIVAHRPEGWYSLVFTGGVDDERATMHWSDGLEVRREIVAAHFDAATGPYGTAAEMAMALAIRCERQSQHPGIREIEATQWADGIVLGEILDLLDDEEHEAVRVIIGLSAPRTMTRFQEQEAALLTTSSR